MLPKLIRPLFYVFNGFAALVGIFALLPCLILLLGSLLSTGQAPLEFPLMLMMLIVTPWLSFFLVRRHIPKENWQRLLSFFCTIEYPIIVMGLTRCLIFQDLSFPLFVNEIVFVLGIGMEIYLLMRRNRDSRPWIKFGLGTAQLTYSLFLIKTALIFFVPTLPAFATAMRELPYLVSSPAVMMTFLWVMTLLSPIIFPMLMLLIVPPIVLLYATLCLAQETFQGMGYRRAVLGVALSIAAFLGIRELALWQPQHEAFAALDVGYDKPELHETLIGQNNMIRRGLLNAYLSRYRYLWDQNTLPNVTMGFTRFDMSQDHPLLTGIDSFYLSLVAEFVYQGNRSMDMVTAADWYPKFFDTEIQEAERSSIRSALQSTLFTGENKAGLMDIDAKRVELIRQNIQITEKGDVAVIEVHEFYRSSSDRDEEVLYHFSLPEDAVLTGLWLSEGDVENKQYAFKVSPRGAAQKTYNNIVAQQKDPALLEQLGPNTYRLRVFPVRHRFNDGHDVDMNMWFSYVTPRNDDGSWPAPQLIEKRNVFWTSWNKRLVNGAKVSFGDAWFPASFAGSTGPGRFALTERRAYLGGQEVTWRHLDSLIKTDGLGPIAIVVDTSASMREHMQAVQQELVVAKQYLAFDLFAVADQHLKPLSPENQTVPFGRQSVNQILDAFKRDGRQYEGLIILTDAGFYEEKSFASDSAIPTYVVHVNKQFPRDYGDALSEFLLQPGNGSSLSLANAILRLATYETLQGQHPDDLIRVTDRSVWTFAQDKRPAVYESSKDWETMAVKQYAALAAGQHDALQPHRTDALLKVHALAKDYGVVTLFSSMIVLINDQQRQMLARAEAKKDAFDRKQESGIEQLQGIVGGITATPEPEEWFFIVAIAVMKVVVMKKQLTLVRQRR